MVFRTPSRFLVGVVRRPLGDADGEMHFTKAVITSVWDKFEGFVGHFVKDLH